MGFFMSETLNCPLNIGAIEFMLTLMESTFGTIRYNDIHMRSHTGHVSKVQVAVKAFENGESV